MLANITGRDITLLKSRMLLLISATGQAAKSTPEEEMLVLFVYVKCGQEDTQTIIKFFIV